MQACFDATFAADSNPPLAGHFPYLAQSCCKTGAAIQWRLRTTVFFKKIAMRNRDFTVATAVSADITFRNQYDLLELVVGVI
ncbi:MAG: hypothetical protein A2W80_01015 [Candidatus Riflebacteria bacterium GWC2_50_8]|nr:MAG: hypothetical protein A2W80_01015 [Candidatus Riflebacteria bacterium GWC2_50_8]